MKTERSEKSAQPMESTEEEEINPPDKSTGLAVLWFRRFLLFLNHFYSWISKIILGKKKGKGDIKMETEATLQEQIDQLKREYIETRSNTINWWLRIIAIMLSFFSFIILVATVVFGFLAFGKLKDLETTAKGHLQEILKHRRTAEEVLREDTYGILIDYSDNRSEDIGLKCIRLFRPQFRKVKISFFVEIP